MNRRVCLFASVLSVFSGCGGCRGRDLRVDGPTPYVRCLSLEPPPARERRAGTVRYEIEGRRLRLVEAPSPLRLAVFGGPALADGEGVVSAATLERLVRLDADVWMLLGDFAPDAARALRLLRQLTHARAALVIVVPGGRDRASAAARAFSDLGYSPWIVDARGLRWVYVRQDEFFVVSGNPNGRYGAQEPCGFGKSDADTLLSDIGTPRAGRRRWLVSWTAPAGWAISRGWGRATGGSDLVASLAAGAGVHGGFFAYPENQALLPMRAPTGEKLGPREPSAEFSVVVSRVEGPALGRADGARLRPRPLLLELGSEGLAWLPESTARPQGR